MFVAAFFQRLIQFAQQLALMLGQLDRCFHRDVAVQIAGEARAHAIDTFAAQSELLARLCAFGQVNGRFAAECGHADFATQCRSGETDGHSAVQIVAVALKHIVFLYADFYVQIAGRAAVGAGFAVAGAAYAHAVVNTRRDFDFQRFLAFDFSLSMARRAWIGDDLAGASAMRAGLLHAEKALAHLHHALALASAAGFG